MKLQAALVLISFPVCFFSPYWSSQGKMEMKQEVSSTPGTMIIEGQSLLREGDLVVRMSRDPSSLFIKRFNRHDQRYSHSGIVVFENGYPYVYHMINGNENPDGKLRRDSLKAFCNPIKNNAFGIFRYNLNDLELESLRNRVHEWFASGVRFDERFNMDSDDRLYCSEMVSKLLRSATRNRISIDFAEMTNAESVFFSAYMRLPVSYSNKFRIIPIDNLYINADCSKIKEYKFEIRRHAVSSATD